MCLAFILGGFAVNRSQAGYAYFGNTSDTISISGGTSISGALTMEAVIYFTAAPSGPTNIFNEYTFGLEDKHLGFDGSDFTGYAFPVGGTALRSTVSLSLNSWHHLAYVFSGIQDRLYLDGTLVAARNIISSVGNSTGNPFIGADPRSDSIPGPYDPSFVGYIDSLRVSNSERYTGASFAAPIGDLTSDANTMLLYNFNEAPGSTTVTDLSGNGLTGTLGTGFSGATAPQFLTTIPEPASSGMLGLGALLLAIRRRHSRVAKHSRK